jgi:hypothetical protein
VYIILSSSIDGKNPIPCNTIALPKPKTKADGPVMDRLLTHHNLVYKSTILEQIIILFKQELIDQSYKFKTDA